MVKIKKEWLMSHHQPLSFCPPGLEVKQMPKRIYHPERPCTKCLHTYTPNGPRYDPKRPQAFSDKTVEMIKRWVDFPNR